MKVLEGQPHPRKTRIFPPFMIPFPSILTPVLYLEPHSSEDKKLLVSTVSPLPHYWPLSKDLLPPTIHILVLPRDEAPDPGPEKDPQTATLKISTPPYCCLPSGPTP